MINQETPLQKYKDHSRSSGVAGFQLAEGLIVVRFKNGSTYEYTNDSASPEAIATMHHLALSGQGLGTFISTHVHNAYARRIK